MIKSASQLSLQSILKIDAATCAAMGALLALASAPAAGLTQISAPLLFWAGLVLFPVAGFMFACAQMRRVPMWATGLVVVGNGLWVLAIGRADCTQCAGVAFPCGAGRCRSGVRRPGMGRRAAAACCLLSRKAQENMP